jgi:hypothetical protein
MCQKPKGIMTEQVILEAVLKGLMFLDIGEELQTYELNIHIK